MAGLAADDDDVEDDNELTSLSGEAIFKISEFQLLITPIANRSRMSYNILKLLILVYEFFLGENENRIDKCLHELNIESNRIESAYVIITVREI